MTALPPEKLAAALGAINSWRLAPDDAVECPVCQSPGLAIVDRSARPYAEWYVLTCRACGLDATINVPLAAPSFGD